MAEDINKEDGYLDSDNKTEEDLESVGNPAPPSDVDLNLLRGDRIGDTVYSGKWCIQTVMKVLQSNVVMKPEETQQTEEGKMEIVDMDEDLQNEVGVLWDMTSNVEVCQYLQSVGAIESIYHVIANSRCPRATEMCVGMLANIVTHDELWLSLHSDSTLFAILIPLFASTDQPVLLELSRFFTTAMSHSESSHCYASMYSYGPLVAQELVRILSGSTNCALLKQTTEMTHILMCLDADDSHFNTLFADPDFIVAVLEASKEIGYDHEKPSQSYVMEILHCFTTYQAGINAMETCMEQITQAVTKYLRSLCHSLNLSGSGDTISIIITILNHIFCRSLAVRMELMSSSKLLQYILKILVVLYRRLGLYDSIAQSPHSLHHYHHHHHHQHHHHHRHHRDEQQHSKHHRHCDRDSDKTESKMASGWENTTGDEEENKSATSKSWSERAGVGDLTPKHSFVTPDPSPKQSQGKETEFLSWSERRIASPLVDGGEMPSDVWKMPHERKAKKTKAKLAKEDFPTVDTKLTTNEERSSDGGTKGNENIDEKPTSSKPLKEDYEQDDNSSTKKLNTDSDKEDDEVSDSQAMRHTRQDSNKSSGFSPSLSDREEAEESMEMEQQDDKTGSLPEVRENGEESGDGSKNSGEPVTTSTVCAGEGDEKGNADKTGANVGKEDGEERRTEMIDGERGRMDRRSNYSNLDKYNKLMNVVREFLSDFFNNMREGLLTEQGVPIVSNVLTYLDTQCRSSSLRALVHCTGPNRDISTPVGRLIHLASRLNAPNLHNVLLECTKSND